MKRNLVGILGGIIIIVLAASMVYLYVNQPQIRYVRSHDLIEKYKGTLEARAAFQQKKNSLMANVDSLRFDFERAKNQYLTQQSKLTVAQRQEQEQILTQRQSQLMQYGQAVEQKIEEEDSKMMQEVLNQINSFIEEYAQQNGFDVILGTTLSGSLLYGDQSMDITEELVDKLNKHYKGE